jgi:hypothetical protein
LAQASAQSYPSAALNALPPAYNGPLHLSQRVTPSHITKTSARNVATQDRDPFTPELHTLNSEISPSQQQANAPPRPEARPASVTTATPGSLPPVPQVARTPAHAQQQLPETRVSAARLLTSATVPSHPAVSNFTLQHHASAPPGTEAAPESVAAATSPPPIPEAFVVIIDGVDRMVVNQDATITADDRHGMAETIADWYGSLCIFLRIVQFVEEYKYCCWGSTRA